MRHIIVPPWKIVRARCWICMEATSVAKLGEATVCEDCAIRALATFKLADEDE